jgi:micrococcal nuclease
MSARSILTVLFFSVLLLLPLACKQPPETVAVIEVIDGDTIVVEGGYHVRYIGIDSPEIDEYYYVEAKQMNAELLDGKKVRLEKDITDKDKYGRLLRYVYVDDVFVNAEMVRQGCAWAMVYPPDIKYLVYLESMEKEARQLKRGFWK